METLSHIKDILCKYRLSPEIDSHYLYSEKVIHEKLIQLRATFTDRFDIFYAVKANPHKEIIEYITRQGCGLDISSSGEMEVALDQGGSNHRLSFAGPGKTRDDLELAVEHNIYSLSIENIDEVEAINDIAREKQKLQQVAIRINPEKKFKGYGIKMGGGTPSPFGIDEEMCPAVLDKILKSEYLKFIGFHVHVGSQILDAESVGEVIRYLFGYALKIKKQFNIDIEYLNFGGGLGVPYFVNQHPIDLKKLRELIDNILSTEDVRKHFAETRFVVEPGRFLVADSGVYISKILYIKESLGKNFIVIDGGLHHNMAAFGLFGQVIRRNYHIDILNTGREARSIERKIYNIVGSLCTPLDKLAEGIVLSDVQVGDYVCVYNSGAYGYSASPLLFLSHSLPTVEIVKHSEII